MDSSACLSSITLVTRNRAVLVGPGAMALTLTPASRSSTARHRVHSTMAALATAYATPSGTPQKAAALAMLMTEPWRRWAMVGQTARQTIMVPIRFRSNMARTSCMGMPRALLGLGLPPFAAMSPPALLTRMEMGPSVLSILWTMAATSSSLAMLAQAAMVLEPVAVASWAATSSQDLASPNSAGASWHTSWMATEAPRWARRVAMARPRPRPEPVTSAT